MNIFFLRSWAGWRSLYAGFRRWLYPRSRRGSLLLLFMGTFILSSILFQLWHPTNGLDTGSDLQPAETEGAGLPLVLPEQEPPGSLSERAGSPGTVEEGGSGEVPETEAAGSVEGMPSGPYPEAPATESVEAATPEPESKSSPKMVYPVTGRVLRGYGVDYWPTLKDWRLHAGLDLAATVGTKVKAAASGRVLRQYRDPVLGLTLELEHPYGVVTRYANLGSVIVEIGQGVIAGQPIAILGDSADGEKFGESHLHFEVRLGGEPVDPVTMID